jgi:hypothetical protein
VGRFPICYRRVRHKIPAQARGTGYEPDTEIAIIPRPSRPAGQRRNARTQPRCCGKLILRDYLAPVLVDDNHNIVFQRGVNKYLIQPGGKPTFNILHMVRPEIHYKLNLLLKHVSHERRMAVEKDVQVRVNDHHIDTDIIVRPINEPGVGESLLLVVFQAKKKPDDEGEPSPVNLPEQEKDSHIRELEQELQSAKETSDHHRY